MAKTLSRLTYLQKSEIHERLKSLIEKGVLKIVDGGCQFAAGWNNQRFVDDLNNPETGVGFRVTVPNVQSLRTDLYGPLISKSLTTEAGRVTTLEAEVRDLRLTVRTILRRIDLMNSPQSNLPLQARLEDTG